jgi:hypothetical protein
MIKKKVASIDQPGEKLVVVTAKVKAKHIENLKLLGEGIASRGIRVLLDATAESVKDLVAQKQKLNNALKFTMDRSDD